MLFQGEIWANRIVSMALRCFPYKYFSQEGSSNATNAVLP